MPLKTAIGAVAITILAATPAFAAVTVTNQDSKPHTVVVNTGPGTTETQHKIAAGASETMDCPQKCGFRDLAFGTSRLAGGDAKLVIDKDGELHFAGGKGDFQMPNGTD